MHYIAEIGHENGQRKAACRCTPLGGRRDVLGRRGKRNKKAGQMALGEGLRRVGQVLGEGLLRFLGREDVVQHAWCGRLRDLRKGSAHLLQHLDALVELSDTGVERDADGCILDALGEELREGAGVHRCACVWCGCWSDNACVTGARGQHPDSIGCCSPGARTCLEVELLLRARPMRTPTAPCPLHP